MQDFNQLISDGLKALDLTREPEGLYAPIAYTLANDGKRLRPMLALMATQMCNGNINNTMPAALALEVFHNFTLLHDDLMDNANTRRNQPTVHKRWNANTAILSGDQMMIEAYKLIAQVPEQYLHQCLMRFSKMATEICEGQQYDMDFEQRNDVTINDYIKMIGLKTAVLPATALQLGALISGADEQTQQLLYDFGYNLGLAFQLRDDYLDVYGNQETFGKAIGGDILDRKKTFLYLTAFKNANEQQTEQLNEWFNSSDKELKIKNITNLYTQTGADKHCLDLIDTYHQKALHYLEAITIDQDAKEPLRQMLNQLMTRNK